MRQRSAFISTCVSVLLLLASSHKTLAQPAHFPWSGEEKTVHFENPPPTIAHPAPGVDYKFDLPKESFDLFVPKNYNGREPFGLFVFMDAGDAMSMPPEWAALMEQEKLLCLIPQKIGNNEQFSRRVGLTFVGLLKTVERYKLDPKRVFTGGMSGGARCSLQLAFLHNDVIAGNISICGANFYERLPRVDAPANSAGYGYWPVPPDCVAAAKRKVRFAFITGAKDFRYGNILDIYHLGFAKNGFQAKLIDQPNMGHQLCSAASLTEALHFVDGNR